MYERIKNFITSEPRGRERKNKNRVIANLMIEDYGLTIPKDKVIDMVGEILNADRQWRLVLKDNIDLRGADYWQKTDLEIAKRKELGY